MSESKNCLKGGWFTFQGRACQREFVQKTLCAWGGAFLVCALMAILWLVMDLAVLFLSAAFPPLALLGFLPILIGIAGLLLMYVIMLAFTLGVWVRRCHDLDMSGWPVGVFWGVFTLLFGFGGLVMALLMPFFGAVPACFLGLVVATVLGCLKGKPGPNRFGPDPMVLEAEVV